MKIRSDSLFSTLSRLGLLDEFFGVIASDNPSYEEMHTWLSERTIKTSNGALHNLITYHMGQWRVRQAVAAADESIADLPADADEKIRMRLHGLRLDLALRDLSEKTAVSLLKLDLAERAQETKVEALRLSREKFAAAESHLQAVKDEIGKARTGGGLTPETLRKIEEAAGLL